MAALVKKAYADLPTGQQIHYRYVLPSASAQDIPIVYLHKSASSSASYVKLMSHYATQGYAGYAPDMPGFGQSFDPTVEDIEAIHARGTAWYTDVFLFVFEQLGLRRFHVIGHHSGASLANQLAATQADRVASICLIGATIIGFEERQKMKERFLKPFNQPKQDGSHLMKTWDYLGSMGLPDGCDLDLKQREAIDHIRAYVCDLYVGCSGEDPANSFTRWRGRNLIYGAVWDQDSEELFQVVNCPVLVLCAKDDVLWYHMDNVTRIKPAAKAKTITGANFSLDLDVDGIVREWDAFQDSHHHL